RTTGRKHYPSVVLVLEHCRKHTHVCLLYFPTRSGWDSSVSPKLTDLHPQFNADSEAQVCFHCRGAFATPARDGIGAVAASKQDSWLVSGRLLARKTRSPSRQIRPFPIHSHADECATAGMIEKDEFFKRRRIEFAIGPQF